MWSEDNSANGCDRGFTDVQALLDHRGAQHEKSGEAAQDEIHQVRLGNGEVIPRHIDRLEVCFCTLIRTIRPGVCIRFSVVTTHDQVLVLFSDGSECVSQTAGRYVGWVTGARVVRWREGRRPEERKIGDRIECMYEGLRPVAAPNKRPIWPVTLRLVAKVLVGTWGRRDAPLQQWSGILDSGLWTLAVTGQ